MANKKSTINVQHVDEQLWRLAKAQAMIEGKRVGDVLTEILRDYFEKKGD